MHIISHSCDITLILSQWTPVFLGVRFVVTHIFNQFGSATHLHVVQHLTGALQYIPKLFGVSLKAPGDS